MKPGAYLHQAQLTPSQVYISRGIAGILTRTILSPLDVLQTINQVGPKKVQKKGIWEEVNEIYEKEGIKGFFKGNLIGCLRFVATGATQVLIYVGLKKLLTSNDIDTTSTIALCTSFSGLIATFITYPLDTIKTRLILDKNKKYSSTWDCLQTTIAEEGWIRLWRGVVPFTIGSFIADDILDRVWESSLVNIANPSPLHSFLVSCLATVVAQTFYYPIDTSLKLVQSASTSESASKEMKPDVGECRTTINAVIQNVDKHGIGGLFRGYPINLLKVIPGVLTAFISFEYSRRFFAHYNTNSIEITVKT